MPSASKKLGLLPPYLFTEIDRKVSEARAKGVDIISLGIGDPDLPPPPLLKPSSQAFKTPIPTTTLPTKATLN